MYESQYDVTGGDHPWREKSRDIVKDMFMYKALDTRLYPIFNKGGEGNALHRCVIEKMTTGVKGSTSITKADIQQLGNNPWIKGQNAFQYNKEYYAHRFKHGITGSAERGVFARQFLGRTKFSGYDQSPGVTGKKFYGRSYTGISLGLSLMGFGDLGTWDDNEIYNMLGIGVTGGELNFGQTFLLNHYAMSRYSGGIGLAKKLAIGYKGDFFKQARTSAEGLFSSANAFLGAGAQSKNATDLLNFMKSGGQMLDTPFTQQQQIGEMLEGRVPSSRYQMQQLGRGGGQSSTYPERNIQKDVRARYNQFKADYRQNVLDKKPAGWKIKGKQRLKGLERAYTSSKFQLGKFTDSWARRGKVAEIEQMLISDAADRQRVSINQTLEKHGKAPGLTERLTKSERRTLIQEQLYGRGGARTFGTKMAANVMKGVQFMFAAQLAYDIVIDPAITAAKETYNYTSEKLQSLTHSDFGRGFDINNGAAASERQRAVQAIQSANLSARTFLGREAEFNH